MNTIYCNAVLLGTFLGFANHVHGAEFLNLDFEEGFQKSRMIEGPYPNGSGLVHRQWWLPGWTFGDSFEEDSFAVNYNKSWFGASDGGTLYGAGYDDDRLPYSGKLSVLGFRSVSGVTFVHVEQPGLIPPNAKSMWYDCVNGPWEVSINGIKLGLYDPHRTTKPEREFREVGVDVSEWAGKEVTLRLTQEPGYSLNALDNIRFSAEAIPEPKRASLLMIGWAALWVMSRR